MNIAVMSGDESYLSREEVRNMCEAISRQGHILVPAVASEALPDGTDMLLSVGGDGTFLVSASMAAPSGIPVLGVNLGRLGFLSENTPGAVVEALGTGNFHIQTRAMVQARVADREFLALNDITVRRGGNSMLGVRLSVDGKELPTYWADGMILATPSGSTAYALSAGGPIVLPASRVLVVAPIAPHNLNVRPLIVPLESHISMEFITRDDNVVFTADNRSCNMPSSVRVDAAVAQFSLKRVCLDNANFIKALSEKLFWGEDKRNEN